MGNEQSTERKLGQLRIWNLVVGLILAVQAVMIAILTNSFALPVTASVEIDADFRHALNQGFGILADYIFGNNRTKTSIEMTAPVTSAQVGEGKKYLVSFTMPSKYTLERLPEPMNKTILLQKIASHQAAALRFSGYLNEKTISKKTQELEAWLNKNNLKVKSYIVAQYNPPWIPGMFRRNEIIAELS
jgi:hypothetical protein